MAPDTRPPLPTGPGTSRPLGPCTTGSRPHAPEHPNLRPHPSETPRYSWAPPAHQAPRCHRTLARPHARWVPPCPRTIVWPTRSLIPGGRVRSAFSPGTFARALCQEFSPGRFAEPGHQMKNFRRGDFTGTMLAKSFRQELSSGPFAGAVSPRGFAKRFRWGQSPRIFPAGFFAGALPAQRLRQKSFRPGCLTGASFANSRRQEFSPGPFRRGGSPRAAARSFRPGLPPGVFAGLFSTPFGAL